MKRKRKVYCRGNRHLGYGRHIGPSYTGHGARAGNLDLIPVCSYINKRNPGLGTKITWETYGQKSLNYNYEWAWIAEEAKFGWKETLNNFHDDWKYEPEPDPVVTVFFSEGIKDRIPELLKQNDND